MDRMQATTINTEQQPINLLTRSTDRMEETPYRKELTNPMDRLPDMYEKEYIDFIDLAAHELDAPLRKLSLLTGRLTDKFEAASQNKEIHAYIDRINSCVHDMQSVMENITVLAKVTSDKREDKSCSIEDILRQVIEGLTIPIKTRQATVYISSPLPLVAGDAAQLFRLFKNLLENALKFQKENVAPEICVQSSLLTTEEKQDFRLPLNKGYHKIEVIDKGIGFKNEYAEKIFRPFVRLHGKSRFAGSGVGLAICRKIVENHQGIIYARSDDKQGTRFILLLPQIL